MDQSASTSDVRMSVDSLKGSGTDRAKKWKVLAFVSLAFFLLAMVLFIVFLTLYLKVDDTEPRVCGVNPDKSQKYVTNLKEPSEPGVFHDVTSAEIKRVRAFLETTIQLPRPENIRLNQSQIYTMELQPPDKAEVLAYLDNKAKKPDRHARVYIFRGDLSPPVVEERVCGPLNKVTSCDVALTAPFNYRPQGGFEIGLIDEHVMPKIQSQLGHILRESYGGSVDYDTCEDDCLNYWITPIGSNIYNETNVRKVWILLMYDIKYYSLLPLDFIVMADLSGVDPTKFNISKVWYAGKLYDSAQELNDAYNSSSTNKTNMTYPVQTDDFFAQMDRRKNLFPDKPHAPPVMQDPDGQRFSVNHRHISYLDGLWTFNFLMQALRGPVLYDIRYQGQRIAYELGLMDLASVYAGWNPQLRQQLFLDISYLMGSRAKALVPGADCPLTATFLPVTLTSQDKTEPAIFSRAICIFERNSGDPLRRHHSYSRDEGTFYGGMLDSALVARTIMSVDNYDYIVEFVFHQNGALGTKVRLSGYLASNFWTTEEMPWGFEIHDKMFGATHLHLFNFKVDMEILGGSSNSYETIQIMEDTVQLRESERNISIVKLEKSLKQNEEEATFQYNFDQPAYHVFYSKQTNEFKFRKGYRLINNGYVKSLVKPGMGNEPVVSWARYQMAVTKFNQSEQSSTSIYGPWDSSDPIIDFERFLENNDNLVDEDLVAWVSMGMYHIPHTEDLPVVDTPGQSTDFYLTPFNYFPEDPSMRSRDGVFIKVKAGDSSKASLEFDTDQGEFGSCLYEPPDPMAIWRKDPDDLFEANENKGVL